MTMRSLDHCDLRDDESTERVATLSSNTSSFPVSVQWSSRNELMIYSGFGSSGFGMKLHDYFSPDALFETLPFNSRSAVNDDICAAIASIVYDEQRHQMDFIRPLARCPELQLARWLAQFISTYFGTVLSVVESLPYRHRWNEITRCMAALRTWQLFDLFQPLAWGSDAKLPLE